MSFHRLRLRYLNCFFLDFNFANSETMHSKLMPLVKSVSMVKWTKSHRLSWPTVERNWFFTLFSTENDLSPSVLATAITFAHASNMRFSRMRLNQAGVETASVGYCLSNWTSSSSSNTFSSISITKCASNLRADSASEDVSNENRKPYWCFSCE